jgi:DNA-binding response OmpR family regulator
MRKILVVDDDPMIADLIADFCRALNFEVRVEHDGLSVQEVAEEWKPDLITLDLEMPIFDGLSVLERLQNHADTRDIPVVIVSATARMALEKGLLDHGVRMVFQKPVPMGQLAGRLKTLVETGTPPPGRGPVFETFRTLPRMH